MGRSGWVAGFLLNLAMAFAATQRADAITIVTLPDASATAILCNSALSAGCPEFSGPSGVWTYNGGGPLAKVVSTLSPHPSVQVSASVPVQNEQATASASLEYYFEVVGPPNQTVPITITTSGSITTPLASENEANVYLTNNFASFRVVAICRQPTVFGGACTASDYVGVVPGSSSFSVSTTESVTSDDTNILTLNLSVVSNTNVRGSSDSQSGYIDPIITIASEFS
jgi:hypothetical protein